MKKTILTVIAGSLMVLGAYGQGSVSSVLQMFTADGITTPGANATSPVNATTWFTGNLNLEIFYSPSNASIGTAQINAINAFNGLAGGGASALALLATDGFSLASATTLTGSTPGSLAYTVSTGSLTTGANTIGLLSPVPTGGSGWLAVYAVANGGAFNGYSGVLSFFQSNLGGNPTTIPAGIASTILRDPQGVNLVLTAVPEPSTLALAALGGVSALLFRRRK